MKLIGKIALRIALFALGHQDILVRIFADHSDPAKLLRDAADVVDQAKADGLISASGK